MLATFHDVLEQKGTHGCLPPHNRHGSLLSLTHQDVANSTSLVTCNTSAHTVNTTDNTTSLYPESIFQVTVYLHSML